MDTDHMTLQKIVNFLEQISEIKACYLFGSRAENKDFELDSRRDWDLALILDNQLSQEAADWLKYELQAKVAKLLGTDAVDLVILNYVKNSELAFAIIRDGICFYDNYPERDSLERRLFHEYCDHIAALKRAGFGND